jgi:hypothetical protein
MSATDDVELIRVAYIALAGIPDFAGRIAALTWLMRRLTSEEQERINTLNEHADLSLRGQVVPPR